MSCHDDEQLEEIEVLSSIYPSELSSHSSNCPPMKGERCKELNLPHSIFQEYYRVISIYLAPSDDDLKNFVSVNLVVFMTKDYPTERLYTKIDVVKGLSQSQIEELQNLSDSLAELNVGMQCVFLIAEGVKTWLEDNNVEGQDGSMYADMLRRMQQKEVETKKLVEKAALFAAADAEQLISGNKLSIDKDEEERIRRRQAGTAVSIETFMTWKAAFDEEQRVLALQNGKEAVKDPRPTGKELFMAHKARAQGSDKGAVAGDLDYDDLDFGDLQDYEGLLDEGEDGEYVPSESDEDEDEDDEDDEEDS